MNDNMFNKCLEAYLNKRGSFWGDLADEFDVESGERLRIMFRSERKKRGVPSKKQMLGAESNGDDNSTVSDEEKIQEAINRFGTEIKNNRDGSTSVKKLVLIAEEEMKDSRRVVELAGYDPNDFSLIDSYVKMYNQGIKGSDENKTLYSFSAKVKPITEQGLNKKDIEELFEKYSSRKNQADFDFHCLSEGDYVLEIDLADLHIGSRPKYEMDESVDERYQRAIADIFEKSKDKNISHIIFAMLGDILHFDNSKTQTSHGTQLESDGSTVREIFERTIDLIIDSTDKLKKIAPVSIVNVHGNHDKDLSYMLARALSLYYKDDVNVDVDYFDDNQKYRHFGKCLVGWVHGNMPKKNQLNWLQIKAKREFGQSDYIESHQGHLHSESAVEDGGVILRGVGTLAGIDNWADNNGYLGAQRKLSCFLWDKEKGLSEIWHVGIG